MEPIDDASPRVRARITGAVYLLFFLTAIAGEFFIRKAGISGIQTGTSGDAAATANSILTHVPAFRLGFALSLISIACYVAVTAQFYQLFRPVSRGLSLIAICFGLIGLAVQAFGSLLQLVPLVVLNGDQYRGVFDAKQLQALALMFLNLNGQVGNISLVFDGLFQLLIAYLILKSTFLPRILGVLMAFSALGWLTVLSPPLANRLLPYITVLGLLGEGSLMLWLLLVGVNAQRWNERANAGRIPSPTTRPSQQRPIQTAG